MQVPVFAFETILAALILLLTVFLYLLAYTIWNRKKNEYWENYRVKLEDHFLPLILDYLDGQESRDEIIRQLTKNSREIRYFLNILDGLGELLDGEQKANLDKLISHKFFYSYYKTLLFSFFKSDQMKACIYFANLGSLDPETEKRLIKVCRTRQLDLTYAATKALQASKEIGIRTTALQQFLSRNTSSRLMLVELLHKYYRPELEQRDEVLAMLGDMLERESISPREKNVIILFIANQGYYEYGPVLLRYFRDLPMAPQNLPLLRALAEAMGKLRVDEASDQLRECALSSDLDLQIASIESLAAIDEKNMNFLADLLFWVDFPVRKKIIQLLTDEVHGNKDAVNYFLEKSSKIVTTYKKKLPVSADSSSLDMLRQVQSATEGIKIMLSKNNNFT